MGFVLLIYGDAAIWAEMPEEERDDVLRLHASLVEELRSSGELVAGAGLETSEATTTLQAGVPAVSGPFARGGEQVSAFYLIESDSQERPLELADRILDPHVRAVEVRPVHTVERRA
jgi:hypothetical protein